MVKNEQSIPSREGAKKERSKFSAFMRSLFGNNASDIRCNVILYLITLIFLAVLIAPFVYVITESFRSRQLVNGLPVEVWSFSAYKSVLGNPNIFRAYVNTIVVTIIGTAVAVALTTVGSYPLSKKDLPGRQVALVYVLITMLFSGGLIPFYILIRNVLQLTDSYLVYIAVGATGAFNIFVVKNYFQGIPAELSESAALDGAGELRIFFSIYLPLSKPIIATVALWVAVGKWNDYMTGLLYIKSQEKLLIQNILRDMLSKATSTSGIGGDSSMQTLAESVKMATVVVSIIPIMLIYPFVQKYFTKGVMVGSVKG